MKLLFWMVVLGWPYVLTGIAVSIVLWFIGWTLIAVPAGVAAGLLLAESRRSS